MTKTIGTLTYHDSDNFGSVLQAYALKSWLQQQNYAASVMDYRKPEVKALYALLKPLSSKYNCISNVYTLLNYSKLYRRKLQFERFRVDYLSLTPRRYADLSELMEDPPKFDAYICGSDQIWNPDIPDFDPAYLLPFAYKSKRIAYAVSTGSGVKSPDCLTPYADLLRQFVHVTVREPATAKTLAPHLAVQPEIAVDPIFLLKKSDWQKCITPVNRPPYMLCYFPGGVTPRFEKYSRALARKMGLRRLILMPEWRNLFRSGQKMYHTGPLEFLSLLAGAAFVCTNSFHGTAFSILLNVPFCVGMTTPHSDQRIFPLLEAAGLTDREITTYNADQIPPVPDFTRANSYIEAERLRSASRLQQILDEVLK